MPDTHLPFPASDAPLWSAYMRDRDSVRASFAIPGHKTRTDMVGDIVATDRPIVLNNDMSLPSLGTLKAAEDKTAALWGADLARFSVNGSSAANQAAMMSVTGPGDTVIVSRTLHKSLLFGLIYSGARPVWISPTVDPDHGLPCGVPADAIRAALRQHPEARAVFVGEPSYVGTYGDVAAQAEVAHEHGVPLVVDAAWAAHFGFHPALPSHAITAGADIMVTSAHKTLPAHTQAAILLAQGDLVNLELLNRAFDGTQTTSQAASILASIDASRAVLEHSGEPLLGRVLSALATTRRRLAQVPGLVVLDGDGVDPMKLVLLVARAGVDGRALAKELRAYGIDVEAADRDMVIPQVTLADKPTDVAMLTDLLIAIMNRIADRSRPITPVGTWQVDPDMVMTPQEAFYAPTKTVSWSDATGMVAGELIAPYPPGIPVVTPGERITTSVKATLEQAREMGVTIAYAADPTLATIRVIDNG